MSRKQFQSYLEANQKNLDPIEGIWYSSGLGAHEVGIMKEHSRPGRDFVGFILNSRNPVWPVGAKKMDIRHGLKPGSYVLDYYLNDFEHIQISMILDNKRRFTFDYQKGPEDTLITYVKE